MCFLSPPSSHLHPPPLLSEPLLRNLISEMAICCQSPGLGCRLIANGSESTLEEWLPESFRLSSASMPGPADGWKEGVAGCCGIRDPQDGPTLQIAWQIADPNS